MTNIIKSKAWQTGIAIIASPASAPEPTHTAPETANATTPPTGAHTTLETVIMKKPFIPHWIFEQGFTARHIAVLCLIAMRGKCFESQKSIAETLHINVRHVRQILKELEQYQWLKVTRKGGAKRWNNCYQLADKLGVRFDASKRVRWTLLGPLTNQGTYINSYRGDSKATSALIMDKENDLSSKQCLLSPQRSEEVDGRPESPQCTSEASLEPSNTNTAQGDKNALTEEAEKLKQRDKIITSIFTEFDHLKAKPRTKTTKEKWG